MADPKLFNLRSMTQQCKDRCVTPKPRRAIFLLILTLTIAFYLLSRWMPRSMNYNQIPYDPCIQARLEELLSETEQMNAIVNHEPLQYGQTFSLPFVGNGYLGISFSVQSYIQLMPDTVPLFLSTDYSPVIQISSNVWRDTHATVIQMTSGLVRRHQCFPINSEHSVHVTHLMYAHRRRPSLLIQQIDIGNPSEQTFDFEFERKKTKSTTTVQQLDKEEIEIRGWKKQFIMLTKQISVREHKSIIFVIITTILSSTNTLKPDSRDKQIIYTVTKFSPVLADKLLLNQTFAKEWQTMLQKNAKQDLTDALSLSPKELLEEHLETWSKIWESGFSISRSLAPATINGDAINRTIYYVLSSTTSPLFNLNVDEVQRKELNQSLFQIDHCYESHSTLFADRLWRGPGDDLAVSQLTSLWRSTLSKRGCSSLMRSGVNGVLQSMLLSIGGIRFRNRHLEMSLDHRELYRDMFFRAIHFGKQYYLNISLTVDHENRAMIDVSIDDENSHAYACDAGCSDTPTKLSTKSVRFPVKITHPATAILYITEDFDYMTQLKDTVHVKEVEIAPPYGHDVLALHRHGHKLGGLPLIFWIILGFLILVFHLFLLKIVLNEMGFFKPTIPSYSRTRPL